MVDIDERVVQMKFDATDFDQNTKKTMSTLDKLREKLSFKDVVDNNAMNTIADNVQKVADKAYTIVDRTIDKIKDNIANKLVNFIQENTVGQLQAGWSKYADMTTSVATLQGQGYAMDRISDQLQRLMYFTDETSFKFTDMVGEIGKFTASGQSLEDATTAMMGIAEWAALSGKNANDASRAMYQLSQALGAGQMRLVDWKSIQNLNMDTKEFRQNAIEAAIAVGTLKDNLDGTYTTLVGKKKGSLSFNIREFSDKLTEGAWFTTEVMMEVYSKYSEAVDDIRAIYDEGNFISATGEAVTIKTTANAVREIEKSNKALVEKFKGTQVDPKDIDKILLKWKEVENVTNTTVEDYAKINGLTEEQAKLEMQEKEKGYAEYLKEYASIFGGTVEEATRALDGWQKYVSDFGLKAFKKSFEAKTFIEAIESAKDAASTVWLNIYQNIFGDYEEATEIWTDLANSLYEIFVDRLWDLSDIFEHWRTGGQSTLENMVADYKAQIFELKNSEKFGEAEAEQVRILEAEIERLNEQIEQGGFRNGRKIFMQGIYAFGSGLKSVIMNFREGWDSLFTTGETGDKLLSWSEKLRVSGFKFYLMMQDLGESDFYTNIAKGIRNLLSPIAAVRNIIHSVVQSFLPSGETFISILNKLAYGFANLTAKIVPSQETIVNIAKILRGIIAFIKLIAKAIIGFYNATIKPFASFVYEAVTETLGKILELFAEIGDKMYEFEEGLNAFQAMEVIGEALEDTLEGIWYLIKTIFGLLWKIVGPVLGLIYRTVKSIVEEVKKMSSGTGGFFGGLAEKFKDVAKRAHDAWFSVNSFKDVFNAYSDQTGLPAFLMMVTDMFDTLITKIGVTILAIFGLDETVANGKMSKGLQTMRDIIADIAIGIKWLYTNVIRPILGTLIEGLGNSLHTLGEQWRTGDLKGFLGTIKQIISTFTSLGLFKFIGTINKVFGAGGLLRVFRNAAKTIKQIGQWFAAKAFKEFTGGILRLAIAFTILVGAATALTFLPTENIEKLNKVMLTFGIMLAATLLSIFGISMALRKSEFSFYGFASAMLSIVAVVGIFIFAISKLHKALTGLFQIEEEYEYKDEAGNTKTGTRMREVTGKEFAARLLSLIAPIILIIGGIAATMAIIKALGGAATLMQFGITVAGLGIGMFMLVNAMDDLLDIFSRKDEDLAAKITGATIYILGLMAILALISRLLTNPKMMGSQSMSKSITGALVMCVTIAGMALVVRGVLIPTLETLADSSYSFLDYVGALIIIAGGMFTIAGVLALMSKNTGSMLNKIGAGIVFILFAKVLQNVVVPLIETFTEMDLSFGTFAAIIAVAAIVMAIAGGIRIIFNALAEIMKAVATLQAKQLVPIILSIGGVIAGVMWLCSYLKKEGNLLNAEEIGLIIASISSVILVIGLFAVLLNREFGKSSKNMTAFSKLIISISVMIGVIGLALAGLLLAVKSLYGENSDMGMVALLTAAVAIVAVIGLSLLALGAAVGGISTSLKGMKMDKAKLITHLIYSLFITILGLVVVLSLGASLIGAVFNGQTANLVITLLFMFLGTLFLLTGAMNTMEAVITELAIPLKALSADKIKRIEVILGTVFIGVAAIMAVMALGTALIGGVLDGYTWETIAPMAGMALGTIFAFISVAEEFQKLAKVLAAITPQKLQYIQSTLLLLFVTIAGIMLVVAGGTAAIAANLGGENAATMQSFVPALSIAGAAVLAFTKIASSFENLARTLTTLKGYNLKNIIVSMGAILVITGLMGAIMTALMNWMAGNGVGGEQNLMNAAALILTIILPFAALVGIIELMIPTADLFMTAAFKISAGLAAIGAGLFFLAGGIQYLREAFGIGKSVAEGVASGIDDNSKVATDAAKDLMKDVDEAGKEEARINSPSKEFAEDGKYIDQGLAQGIKKNTSLAEKAAEGLAVVTNKSFQKELKIASPSKVFYENGKFVIRGFINGAQSEYQKNKDMGAAMGEGFADSALEGMKDGWAGLWDGEEMDAWIKKFSEEGGLNFGENAGQSLLAAFLGTDTSADENALDRQLTAQEQQAIGLYDQKIKELNWKIEGLTIHGKDLATYGAAPEAIQDNNKEIARLKKELAEYQKKRDAIVNGTTTKKKVGGIFGGLGNVFDGLGEEFGNILSSSMLGSLGEWFGAEGKGLKDITDTFDSALSTAGESGAGAFTSRIFKAFGLDKENNDITDLGKKVGSGFLSGVLEAFTGALDKIVSTAIYPFMLAWNMIPDIVGGLSDAEFNAWKKAHGFEYETATDIKNSYKKEASGTNNGSSREIYDLTHVKSDGSFKDSVSTPTVNVKLSGDALSLYENLTYGGAYALGNGTITQEQYDDIQDYLKSINKNSFTALTVDEFITVLEKMGLSNKQIMDAMPTGYKKALNAEEVTIMSKDEYIKEKERLKNLLAEKEKITVTNAETASSKYKDINSLNTQISEIDYILEQYDKLFDEVVQNDLNEKYRLKVLNNPSRSFNYEEQKKMNNGTFVYSMYDITNHDAFNDLQSYFKTDVYADEGKYLAQMLYLGFEKGWLDDANGVLSLVGMTMEQFVAKVKSELGINSPSTVAESIGSYFMQGIPIGIDEELPEVLSSINQATDLITEETIAGLNGMQYMLDNDITPSVTPVFDSSQLQNGVDTINSAIDSMSPRVESAIGSFGYESTDYTNNLNALSSRIEGTNNLVNTLIGMLEAGAGINVNITAEPDPYNLYNLVVDQNRTEFKRTGRNNLAY